MGEGAKPPVLASSFGPSPIVRDALRGGLGAKKARSAQRTLVCSAESSSGRSQASSGKRLMGLHSGSPLELFVPRNWADYTECGRSETIRYDAPLY